MSPRGGHRDVTIREGTGERNWYPIAGYAAVAIGGAAFFAVSAIQGNTLVGGSVAITVLFILLLGALPVFWSLFKDAAYIRDTRAGWRPKWWYYIGAPFAVAVTVYLGVDAAGWDMAGGTGAVSFTLASAVSNVYYLYQRHRFVGVP